MRTSLRPSPALVISILALVMATAGTAAAARVLITSSSQIARGSVNSGDIADGAVSRSDLRANAVNSDKVRNGALKLEDLESTARQAVQAAGTQTLEAFRLAGPSDVPAGEFKRVATLANIPPGVYAVFGKTILTAKEPKEPGLLGEGRSQSGHCTFDVGGDIDEARALLGSPGANSPGELSVMITRSFSAPGTAALTCDVQGASWSATNTSILAVRVGKAARSPVEG